MPRNLLHQALTQRNLREAWRRVEDNAGAPGVDGVSVGAFAADLTMHLRSYPAAVLGGRYRATALRECLIPKADDMGHPAGTRRLAIPTVADRWLQTAVAIVLTPRLEAHFADVSFAYRRGRGVQQAITHVAQLRDAGYCWVVDADIERFFDTIPHDTLINQLIGVLHGSPAAAEGTAHLSVAERRLFTLIREWLRAPLLCTDGTMQARDHGAPQGSPLSPLLANLYLDTLDDAMIDADHRIVRFADDFLVLCKSRIEAEEALELTRDVLDSLQLRLNSEKTRIIDFNTGFRFLGVNFVRTLAVPRIALRRPSDARSRASVAIAPMTAPDTDALSPHRNIPAPAFDHPASAVATPNVGRPAWSDPEPETALQAELRESGLLNVTLHEPASSPSHDKIGGHAATVPERQLSNDENNAGVSQAPESEYTAVPRATSDTLRPMPVLRTLYLMEQGASVTLEGERWVVTHEQALLLDLGLAHIEMVLVFGNVSISTPALQGAMRHGIPVSYLSRTGSHYGSLHPTDQQHARVLRDQVLVASFDMRRIEFARAFVRAKLANSRTLLQRLGRRRTELAALVHDTAITLRDAGWRTKTADEASLRGIEGAAAAAYWRAMRAMLPAGWDFPCRVERNAPDPVNAMLSFGYSLLRANIVALLNAHGLNPQVGLYHRDTEGHAALASDLLEEFRALIVDALVWSLISRREMRADDFSLEGARARMTSNAARRFVHAFEDRMQAPISVRTQSSVDGVASNRDPISPRHLMLRQIRDLARALRADSDPYTPFIGR